MSIITVQGVLNGLQAPQYFNKVQSAAIVLGRLQSYWGVAGAPGAGTFNTTLAGGTYSSSSSQVTGQIPHFDPASGNSYLARFEVSSLQQCNALVCDRLWDNGGITITSTTAQTVNSVTWPARDNTGTTNGVGVLLGVEVSAATGAGTPTLTIGYTNSAGTAGRTATNYDLTTASATAGGFYRMGLQAGDLGVQSVQSITLSATWTSGTINIVAYRVLGEASTVNNVLPATMDALTGGFTQIFNGTVPFLMIFGTSFAGTVSICGQYVEAQG